MEVMVTNPVIAIQDNDQGGSRKQTLRLVFSDVAYGICGIYELVLAQAWHTWSALFPRPIRKQLARYAALTFRVRLPPARGTSIIPQCLAASDLQWLRSTGRATTETGGRYAPQRREINTE